MNTYPGYGQDTVRLLEQDKWFASLPIHLKQGLLGLARTRRYSRGQTVFARGHAYDGIYCVLRGQVRLQTHTFRGALGVLQTLAPSQWFGELALFDHQARLHDAQCARPTVLLHLPAPALDKIIGQHPEASHHLGGLLAHKMRCLLIGLEAYALLPTQTWMARRLLMLAMHHWTTDAVQSSIPMRQEELAHMLALTRQTVCRMLQDFETAGVLQRGYGHIRILDWTRLREMAEMPAPPESADAARQGGGPWP